MTMSPLAAVFRVFSNLAFSRTSLPSSESIDCASTSHCSEAPGHPEVAVHVRQLLATAGFKTAADPDRGFDHGTFVPLKLTYPEADVPTVQLSLKRGLDPKEHIAIGRALRPLRDEGIFIIGSGMTFARRCRFLGLLRGRIPDDTERSG
jgi:hypothetical protein